MGPHNQLEAERVFASVARALLGEEVDQPTIGRYQVEERLGAGGMGEVYGAYDPEHDRQVAIKVLRADLRAEPGAREDALRRLRREARVLMSLEHPHVVRVLDVGQIEDGVFIAMERLHGETLADYLVRESLVPHTTLWPWMRAVADAIGTAHDKGIVHRDLKPANLWLARSDDSARPRMVVLDFGIAKGGLAATLDASTKSGTVLGTPHYMSPEQARDSTKIDHRCDLWALAIVVYECVVGQRPFTATNLGELAVQILTESPPRPSAHAVVPAGFDAWFGKATHRQIERRFSDVRSQADALGRVLDGSSRRVSVGRWGLAAGVAALVGLGGWAATRSDSSTESKASADSIDGAAVASPSVVSATNDLPAALSDVPLVVAPPTTVMVTFDGLPDGAVVTREGRTLAVVPAPVELPHGDASTTLRITADGFVPFDAEVVPDRDRRVRVRLTRATPKPSRPLSSPAPQTVDDLEF